jgi:hypothetical protein
MMSFHLPEAEYCVFGYEPDHDSLPWQESYIAAKQRDEAGASGGSVRYAQCCADIIDRNALSVCQT